MRDDKFYADDLLRRYLLGELGDEEVDRLEERLLQDDDLFEALEAVEGDLLAACARGDLDPEERDRVLSRLASSPGGRDRFALIQGITRIAAEPRRNVVPFPVRHWLPLAASLLIMVGGGGWLVREIIHPPTGGQVAKKEPAAAPGGQTPSPVQVPPVTPAPPVGSDPAPGAAVTPPATPAPTPVPPTPPPGANPPGHRVPDPSHIPVGSLESVVFKLALSTVRSAEGISQLKIPHTAERVELRVDLEGDEHALYNVSLMNLTTGDDTWEKTGVPPQDVDGVNALLLDMPAESFPDEGYYQLTVYGLPREGQPELAGAPEFEVVRTVS